MAPMLQSNGTRCGGFIGFLVTAGFIVLIYWATYQPHHIRATVTSAALFNLTVYNNATAAAAAATVSYHLSVSLGLYNPSRRVNIYYDSLDVNLRFGETVLGPANDASPAEFYQLRKSTDAVEVKFDRTGVAVAGEVAAELQKEVKDERAVSFEVVIGARVRYRFGIIKIRQKPRIRCTLTIPVKAEGRGGGVDGLLSPGDRCSVKY